MDVFHMRLLMPSLRLRAGGFGSALAGRIYKHRCGWPQDMASKYK
jgi:hypothetical protein